MQLVNSERPLDLLEVVDSDLPILKNQTLSYTFSTYLTLKEDEEVLIETTGSDSHAVDLVYWNSTFNIVVPPILPNTGNETQSDEIQIGDPVINPGKLTATPREMSGLSYTGISAYNQGLLADSRGRYHVKKYIRIAKAGRYFMRVRSLNGRKSTAGSR